MGFLTDDIVAEWVSHNDHEVAFAALVFLHDLLDDLLAFLRVSVNQAFLDNVTRVLVLRKWQ